MYPNDAGRRRALLATVLLTLMALLLIDLAATPAQAAGREFLPKAVVQAEMGGTGTWSVSTLNGVQKPMGTRPGRCRSDLPVGRAEQIRFANYSGPLGGPFLSGIVEVGLFKFGSRREARSAVTKVSRWVPDCPRTVEWYCQNCDGAQVIHRSTAKRRKVGVQSYSWNERTEFFHGMASGRAIAARKGRTVIVMRAMSSTDAEGSGVPPTAPTWRTAVSLARQSLAEATS